MSIYTALRAGVSGLTANSSALAVISDNIANVNTVGYKRSGVDFSALVNAQNSNTTYNAGGVLPLTRQQISLQGSLEQSRSTTDLAISGDGFFIVSPNNQQLSNGGSCCSRAPVRSRSTPTATWSTRKACSCRAGRWRATAA